MLTRTELLMLAFGWQGGTVHQICEVVGLDTTEFLYSKEEEHTLDHWKGWGSYRTCDAQYIKDKDFVGQNKGNLQYWLGVVGAVSMTIKLGELPTKKF